MGKELEEVLLKRLRPIQTKVIEAIAAGSTIVEFSEGEKPLLKLYISEMKRQEFPHSFKMVEKRGSYAEHGAWGEETGNTIGYTAIELHILPTQDAQDTSHTRST
jgi:hypothetical protein